MVATRKEMAGRKAKSAAKGSLEDKQRIDHTMSKAAGETKTAALKKTAVKKKKSTKHVAPKAPPAIVPKKVTAGGMTFGEDGKKLRSEEIHQASSSKELKRLFKANRKKKREETRNMRKLHKLTKAIKDGKHHQKLTEETFCYTYFKNTANALDICMWL